MRLDDALEPGDLGFLIYDGVHPVDAGNRLITELLAAGLQRALAH